MSNTIKNINNQIAIFEQHFAGDEKLFLAMHNWQCDNKTKSLKLMSMIICNELSFCGLCDKKIKFFDWFSEQVMQKIAI